MAHLIDKDTLVQYLTGMVESACCDKNVERIIRKFIIPHINSLEVKEVDEQKERMIECPYRLVVCAMYEDKILECNGACSWVVDYPKLKELKAQKGDDV